MPDWREIPCWILIGEKEAARICFHSHCGEEWYVWVPLAQKEPYLVSSGCGRRYWVVQFSGLPRVWEILEDKEE